MAEGGRDDEVGRYPCLGAADSDTDKAEDTGTARKGGDAGEGERQEKQEPATTEGGADEAAERAGLHVFDDPRGGVENDAVRRRLG